MYRGICRGVARGRSPPIKIRGRAYLFRPIAEKNSKRRQKAQKCTFTSKISTVFRFPGLPYWTTPLRRFGALRFFASLEAIVHPPKLVWIGTVLVYKQVCVC